MQQKQKSEPEEWAPNEPLSEEEAPGRVTSAPETSVPDAKKTYTAHTTTDKPNVLKSLEPKDSSAYSLTTVCIIIVFLIWLIDFIVGRPTSELTEKVVELLKYVITASLGYFFATSTNKKKD